MRSHWSIGVFRWEYVNTVLTSRFLCLAAQFENIQSFRKTCKLISSKTVEEMEKNFPKFWSWFAYLLPLIPREKKQKKEEPQRMPSSLDDLVDRAQVKTTKYATNTQ